MLGCAHLLGLEKPDASLSLTSWGAPSLPDDLDTWRAERAACVETEAWARSAAAEDVDGIRRELGELPSQVEAALRRSRASEPLTQSDLFAIKRTLFTCWRVIGRARELFVQWRDADADIAYCEHLMSSIHPEVEHSSRFLLSDSLDPALADARKAQKVARRAFAARRKLLVETLRADYPAASFGLDGTIRMKSADSARAESDARFVKRGAFWALADVELDELGVVRDSADAEVEAVESRVLLRLSNALVEHTERISELIDALVVFDLRCAKVRLRQALGGCWPEHDDERCVAVGMFDPRIQEAQRVEFELDADPVVLTGPNMGGKSSLLRALGLSSWCARFMLPAPAVSFRAPAFRAIVYVGSDEPSAADVTEGLSSFGREIRRVVECVQSTPAPALWLLDEVGRGTRPDEGAALAAEIVEVLRSRGHSVILATHFPDLVGLAGACSWRIRGVIEREALERFSLDHSADPAALEAALRAAMDYAPERAEVGDDVPRDARLIARLLGWDPERF